MNSQVKWAAALIVCLSFSVADQVQAQRQNNYRNANSAAVLAGSSLASYNTFENSYDCELGSYNEGYEVSGDSYGGTCSNGSCYQNTGGCGRSGQFFVGADYLNIRSTFSESTAYVTRSGGTPIAGSVLVPPITNTFHELQYDYEPSYRVYGGYRFCECGGEIRFAFTQFNSSGAADSGPVPLDSNGQSTQFLFPGELPATETGERIQTSSNVDARIFDVGFAKTIPLGSPACCNSSCDTCCGSGCNDSCCDSGCDSCCGNDSCGCWCPAWDIKWSAGLRIADIGWDRVGTMRSPSTLRDGQYRATTMEFEGAGARIGLEGTRYIGRRQRFALFAKSDLSLLLGDVNIVHVNDVPLSNGLDIVTKYSSTQLIPVLDIEVGGTAYLCDYLSISGGYLFSAWHDLGMRDTFDVLEGEGPMFDDANILGFDGFFVRSELTF